ncbi:unnamed protein product [Withania somnifera]
MCRQSSTRWTPTSDQIRILKELYYNNGVRSPTAEQIQRISAKLRQYGKIEGKNVFYWFQNHKARERQKKRLIAAASATTDTNININNTNNPTMQMRPHVWRPVDHEHKYNNNTTNSGAVSYEGFHCPSTSSHGVLAVGQNGHYGYGTLAMEKSFRDCSISQGGNSHNNFTWVEVDPYMTCPTTYPFLEKSNKLHYEETLDEEQEDYQRGNSGLETLPLFPMHEEKMMSSLCSSSIKYHESSGGGGWYPSSDDHHHNNLAALELSLNSFIARSPNFP